MKAVVRLTPEVCDCGGESLHLLRMVCCALCLEQKMPEGAADSARIVKCVLCVSDGMYGAAFVLRVVLLACRSLYCDGTILLGACTAQLIPFAGAPDGLG